MAAVGRSHRSKAGKAKLKEVIDLTRTVLGIPEDYRIAIVARLRHRGGRNGDVVAARRARRGCAGLGELREGVGHRRHEAAEATTRACSTAPYGAIPDLAQVDFTRDVVFTWNGTTSGVRVPNGDWIRDDRQGLDHLRRHLGGIRHGRCRGRSSTSSPGPGRRCSAARRAHGMLVLCAARRGATRNLHAAAAPAEDLPPDQGRQARSKAIFEGETINTPSMLCVEDALDGLAWAEQVGGLPGLIAPFGVEPRGDRQSGSGRRRWVEFLARDPATRSCTSICLAIVDPWFTALAPDAQQKAITSSWLRLLEKEGVALRHRLLPRRAAGPAHLGRRDRRDAPTSRRCCRGSTGRSTRYG